MEYRIISKKALQDFPKEVQDTFVLTGILDGWHINAQRRIKTYFIGCERCGKYRVHSIAEEMLTNFLGVDDLQTTISLKEQDLFLQETGCPHVRAHINGENYD